MVVEVCENPYVLNIILFVESIIKIMFYILPGGVTLMIIIDLFKAIIKGEDKANVNLKLSIKRLINVVGLFLVPTIVGFVMQFVNDLELFNGDYAACLKNTSSVKEYALRYDALAKEEEEKREANRQYLFTEEEYKEYLERKKGNYIPGGGNKNNNSDDRSSYVGQTFNLTDSEIRNLTAVCICEQGATKAGVSGEASLMANVYEYVHSKKSLFEWVHLHPSDGGWFSTQSTGGGCLKEVTNELFESVKDVLVNGNRTLPLYVNEHDCWFCQEHNGNRCKNGNKGDICYLNNGGGNLSSKSDITNRANYKKDITKIYSYYKRNDYGDDAYYVFYTFLNSSSDPFGYTMDYYKRITTRR